jgi:hypothetical protein
MSRSNTASHKRAFAQPAGGSDATLAVVARHPHDLHPPPLDFIDDGLTDEARSAALADWLDHFDQRPAITIAVRAADRLAELRSEGEI